MTCGDARVARRRGHRGSVGQFLFGREMCPEERDAIRAMGAIERAPDARRIVDVGRDDFGASRRKRARAIGIHGHA